MSDLGSPNTSFTNEEDLTEQLNTYRTVKRNMEQQQRAMTDSDDLTPPSSPIHPLRKSDSIPFDNRMIATRVDETERDRAKPRIPRPNRSPEKHGDPIQDEDVHYGRSFSKPIPSSTTSNGSNGNASAKQRQQHEEQLQLLQNKIQYQSAEINELYDKIQILHREKLTAQKHQSAVAEAERKDLEDRIAELEQMLQHEQVTRTTIQEEWVTSQNSYAMEIERLTQEIHTVSEELRITKVEHERQIEITRRKFENATREAQDRAEFVEKNSNTLQQEITRLKLLKISSDQRIKEYEQENRSLESKMELLKKENADLDKLRNEINNLSEINQETLLQYEILVKEKESLINTHRSELRAKEAEVEHRDRIIQDLTKDTSSNKEKYQIAVAQHEMVQREKESLLQTHETELKLKDQEIAQKERDLKSKQAEAEHREKAIQELTKENSSLKEKSYSASGEIERLTREKETLVKNFEIEVKYKESAISQKDMELKAKESEVEHKEKIVQDLTKENNSLKERGQVLSAENEILNREKDVLVKNHELELKYKDAELESKNRMIDEATSDITSLREKVQLLTAETEDQQKEIAKYRQTEKELRNEHGGIEKLKTRLSKLTDNNQELKLRVELLIREKDSLCHNHELNLKNKDNEFAQKLQFIEDLKGENNALVEKIQLLVSENDGLKKELSNQGLYQEPETSTYDLHDVEQLKKQIKRLTERTLQFRLQNDNLLREKDSLVKNHELALKSKETEYAIKIRNIEDEANTKLQNMNQLVEKMKIQSQTQQSMIRAEMLKQSKIRSHDLINIIKEDQNRFLEVKQDLNQFILPVVLALQNEYSQLVADINQLEFICNNDSAELRSEIEQLAFELWNSKHKNGTLSQELELSKSREQEASLQVGSLTREMNSIKIKYDELESQFNKELRAIQTELAVERKEKELQISLVEQRERTIRETCDTLRRDNDEMLRTIERLKVIHDEELRHERNHKATLSNSLKYEEELEIQRKLINELKDKIRDLNFEIKGQNAKLQETTQRLEEEERVNRELKDQREQINQSLAYIEQAINDQELQADILKKNSEQQEQIIRTYKVRIDALEAQSGQYEQDLIDYQTMERNYSHQIEQLKKKLVIVEDEMLIWQSRAEKRK